MSKFDHILKSIKPASSSMGTPKIFIYGPPGTGKTHFVGSMATAGQKVLLLKAEHGDLTIRDTAVSTFPLMRTDEDKSQGGIREKFADVLRYLQSPECDYDVIALDGITSAAELLISELRAKGMFAGRAALQTWGIVISWVKDTVASLLALPKTIVVLCHSVEKEDGDNKMVIRPMLNGKLSASITANFDIAAYSATRPTKDDEGVEGIKYVMLTQYPGDKYNVKDRTSLLDTMMSNDYAKWMEKLDAGS